MPDPKDKAEKKEPSVATTSVSSTLIVEKPGSVVMLREAFPDERERVDAFILTQGAGVKKTLTEWKTAYAAWKLTQ